MGRAVRFGVNTPNLKPTQTKGPAFAGLFVDIRLFWRYLEVSLSVLIFLYYQIQAKKSSPNTTAPLELDGP